jgi:TPP-dependent 2-oxoacid decarboxylase
VHHTLGNGEFGLFSRMAEPVVCAQAIMTPENCVAETERLIAAALYHRRPVYMAFPTDYAITPVIAKAVSGKQDRLHPAGHHHRALRTARGGDRGGRRVGPALRDHVDAQMRAR